jgi:hypothetical protein
MAKLVEKLLNVGLGEKLVEEARDRLRVALRGADIGLGEIVATAKHIGRNSNDGGGPGLGVSEGRVLELEIRFKWKNQKPAQ